MNKPGPLKSFTEMDSTSTVRLQTEPPSKRAVVGQDPKSVRRDGSLSPADDGQSSAVDQLNRLYGPVLEPLRQVETQLVEELRSPFPALSKVLRHGTQLGGKRLRPAMLLLSGRAAGKLSADHVTLGTVIEMVHTATLVHDDVLDEAEARRHVPTVNARWNEHTSILLGDYLFAQSFRLAATLSSTEACQMIGEASRQVCEGELRQVLQRDMVDLDESTYLSIVGGKTGQLCRVACELGARFAGAAPEVSESMATYGYSVGVAFQIADDFLDLWGDDDAVGKTLGTDILQGKMTLPLIRLMQTGSPSERSRIREILHGPAEQRLAKIRPLLESSDAQAYTIGIAEDFQQQAITALDVLEESEAKSSLAAIANFSVHRRF